LEFNGPPDLYRKQFILKIGLRRTLFGLPKVCGESRRVAKRLLKEIQGALSIEDKKVQNDKKMILGKFYIHRKIYTWAICIELLILRL
jgi:hypothetical protein